MVNRLCVTAQRNPGLPGGGAVGLGIEGVPGVVTKYGRGKTFPLRTAMQLHTTYQVYPGVQLQLSFHHGSANPETAFLHNDLQGSR